MSNINQELSDKWAQSGPALRRRLAKIEDARVIGDRYKCGILVDEEAGLAIAVKQVPQGRIVHVGTEVKPDAW